MAELLIASLLGLLLSASILSALYASLQSNNLKHAHEEMHESAALAIHFLKQDIRALGFKGCLAKSLKNVKIISKGAVAEQLNSAGFITINKHQFKQSDSLSFVAVAGIVEDVIDDMAYVHSDIDLTAESEITIGQEVLITNCQQADLVAVSKVWNNRLSHNKDVNLEGNLNYRYKRGAIVFPLSVVEYKIAIGASGNPGLYRKSGKSRFQELVPRVERMTIRYTLKNKETGVSGTYRLPESSVNQNFVSVDVELLLASEKEVMPFPMMLTNEHEMAESANDKRLYKVYQFTVALLNNG
jgi:hypothetical protein